MGARGPAPKRTDQRRRRNAPAMPTTKAAGAGKFEPPGSDPEWHPVARQWYESLRGSGQSRFYEPSDWATAFLITESISRELKPQPVTFGTGEDRESVMVSMPPKGASLAAWLKGMTALLVTEGDRRRAALELQRPQGEKVQGDGSVSSLDAWRSRVDGTG